MTLPLFYCTHQCWVAHGSNSSVLGSNRTTGRIILGIGYILSGAIPNYPTFPRTQHHRSRHLTTPRTRTKLTSILEIFSSSMLDNDRVGPEQNRHFSLRIRQHMVDKDGHPQNFSEGESWKATVLLKPHWLSVREIDRTTKWARSAQPASLPIE